MSRIEDVSSAAAIATVALADLIKTHFGVEVQYKVHDVANDLRVFRAGHKIWFSTLSFKIGERNFSFKFKNVSDIRFAVEVDSRGFRWRALTFHEKKGGLDYRAIIGYVENYLTRAAETAKSLAKDTLIKEAGDRIAAEVKPLLENKRQGLWTPSLQVHTGNDSPVFNLTLNLDETGLRKVAALLATL